MCRLISVNIVASVSGTTVNITKYVIILISVIIGVGDGGGGGGWYIWLTTFMIYLLITFTMIFYIFLQSSALKKTSKIIAQQTGNDIHLKV